MQASGMTGMGFGGQMIISQPQGMVQPGFIQSPWFNCENTVMGLPPNTMALGAANLPLGMPIQRSIIQEVAMNTSMAANPLSFPVTQPPNYIQAVEIMPMSPTLISSIGGLPMRPVITSTISSMGVAEPIIPFTINNRSLSSQGIMDPILYSSQDIRRMAEMGLMMPQIVYSTTNSIMQQMQLPYMFMEVKEPYYSDGPDIPLTVSRILGPSPTAGHRIPNNMSPPSLPPHLTQMGLRISQAQHQIGAFELMPSGNILGLDTIRPFPLPQMSPPMLNPPLIKKTLTTTEILQPANQLAYPSLSSPPGRPVSPFGGPLTTSIGNIPGAIPRSVSPPLPFFR
jgi:hypothetical protein